MSAINPTVLASADAKSAGHSAVESSESAACDE
jgi:hypothetical protein